MSFVNEYSDSSLILDNELQDGGIRYIEAHRAGGFYILWLSLALIVSLVVLWNGSEGLTKFALAMGLSLYVLVFIVHVLRAVFSKHQPDWLAPDFIFLLFFGAFHFGYVGPYLIGKVEFAERIFYSTQVGNKCVLFSVVCGIAFLFGYEFARAIRSKYIIVYDINSSNELLLLIGKILFLAGVGLNVLGGFLLGFDKVSNAEFFAEAQLQAIDIRVFSIGGLISTIGLIIYVVCSYLSKGKLMSGIVFPLAILSYLGLNFISGRRASFLIACLPLILVYNYTKNHIKGKWILVTIFAAAFIFAVIKTAREVSEYNPVLIFQTIFSAKEINPILDASLEAGGSLQTVNQTMTLVPETQPYWHGSSYWTAIKTVVPNILPGLRVGLAPSTWLTYTMKEAGVGGGAGLGSSIAMEAYLNFGNFGFLILFFVGMLHRWLYDAFLSKMTITRLAVLVTAVIYLCVWSRNWSGAYIRQVSWMFLICFTIENLCRKKT
ncbi:MAG: O-antigen polymerase [Sedimentisphaerales bacterium]